MFFTLVQFCRESILIACVQVATMTNATLGYIIHVQTFT